MRSTGLDKVSNGRLLPKSVDLRSASGRRMKHLISAFAQALKLTAPSELEMTQLRQLAALTLASERLAADIVNGVAVDGDQCIRINSEIRRLMRQLGVKPAAESKPAGPTDLDRYLRDKYGAPAEPEDEPEAEAAS
jgi:hypothetical protein